MLFGSRWGESGFCDRDKHLTLPLPDMSGVVPGSGGAQERWGHASPACLCLQPSTLLACRGLRGAVAPLGKQGRGEVLHGGIHSYPASGKFTSIPGPPAPTSKWLWAWPHPSREKSEARSFDPPTH